MIPTSIDGTDITGATIDGTDVTEITVDGQTVFSAIPDSGVLRWTFDNSDTQGATALDVWHDNDGTITGATTGVSGANQTYTTNEAYSFDGSDDEVDFDVQADTIGVNDVGSLSAWINSDVSNDGLNHRLFEDRSTSSSEYIQIAIPDSNGKLRVELVGSSGGDQLVGSTTISTGTWYHTCCVWDLPANDVFIYIDGTQDASDTSYGSGVWNPSGDLILCGDGGFSGQRFDGTVDDVRLYDKALSSSEVSDLYNTGSI